MRTSVSCHPRPPRQCLLPQHAGRLRCVPSGFDFDQALGGCQDVDECAARRAPCSYKLCQHPQVLPVRLTLEGYFPGWARVRASMESNPGRPLSRECTLAGTVQACIYMYAEKWGRGQQHLWMCIHSSTAHCSVLSCTPSCAQC